MYSHCLCIPWRSCKRPKERGVRDQGRKVGKPVQELAPPALTQGPTCKGQSPKVTRADHSLKLFPAGTCHHPVKSWQRRERFPWAEPLGFGVTETWESRGKLARSWAGNFHTGLGTPPQPMSASNPYKHRACPQHIHPPREAFDWHPVTVPSEQPNEL